MKKSKPSLLPKKKGVIDYLRKKQPERFKIEQGHTPIPWKRAQRISSEDGGGSFLIDVYDPKTQLIIARVMGNTKAEAIKLADRIVQACNSHDVLVEALEIAREWMGTAMPVHRQMHKLSVAQTIVDEALNQAKKES